MAQTLDEFLISVKYNIDTPSQQTFFDALKRAATSVAGVAGEMTGLSLAVLKLTETMAKSGERLYWMSQRLGDSVSDIQNMAFAMSNLGESAEQATAGIERFGSWTRSMGPAATGYLRALGITATDTVGRMRQLGEYFRAHGGTQAQQGSLEYSLTLRRAQMMGIDEQTMLALSNPNRAAMEQQAGLMQRLVWGKNWQTGPQQFATQAVEVMNQFRKMGFFFQNLSEQFGLGLFNAVLPDLGKINDLLAHLLPHIQEFLNHLISYAPAAMHFLEGAIKAFGILLELANTAMDTFDKLPGSFQAMLGAIFAIGPALKMLGSPIFWLMAGLTALLLLLSDFKYWQKDQENHSKVQHSYINWGTVGKAFEPLIETGKKINELLDRFPALKTAIEWLGGAIAIGAVGKLTGAFDVLKIAIAAATALITGPAGLIAAVVALGAAWAINAVGQQRVYDRARKEGWDVDLSNPHAPQFKKDGENIDMGEMLRRWGAGGNGLTLLESLGIKPLPGEPGGRAPEPYTPNSSKMLHEQIWDWIRGLISAPGQGAAAPDSSGRNLILGSRASSYQLASAGNDWAVPGGFGTEDDSDRLFDMLRLNLEAMAQKLSDLLDTLNAMARKMGIDRSELGGGGGGGGDLLAPGAGSEEQEAKLRDIEQRESGGRNVLNASGPGGRPASSASGFYQMIDSTWLHAARLAGIDTSRYPRAIDAPHSLQHAAALALINEQGERPWASSAHGISHRPLGADSDAPGWAGRHLNQQRGGSINNQTTIHVTAPSPASAAAQVAEHQGRVFERHVRFAKGSFVV